MALVFHRSNDDNGVDALHTDIVFDLNTENPMHRVVDARAVWVVSLVREQDGFTLALQVEQQRSQYFTFPDRPGMWVGVYRMTAELVAFHGADEERLAPLPSAEWEDAGTITDGLWASHQPGRAVKAWGNEDVAPYIDSGKVKVRITSAAVTELAAEAMVIALLSVVPLPEAGGAPQNNDGGDAADQQDETRDLETPVLVGLYEEVTLTSFVCSLVYPLDIVKLRLQCGVEKVRSATIVFVPSPVLIVCARACYVCARGRVAGSRFRPSPTAPCTSAGARWAACSTCLRSSCSTAEECSWATSWTTTRTMVWRNGTRSTTP